MVDVPSTTLDAETVAHLGRVRPGGICLFKKNIESRQQVRALVEHLRELLGPEVLVAIDQEGGGVVRTTDLPFPPSGELPFEEFRASLPTVWRDGTRRAPETRPIARALAERAPVSDEVCELRDGVVHVYSATAIPFFDDARRYLGAAVYWRYQEQFALGAGGYPASRSGRA